MTIEGNELVLLAFVILIVGIFLTSRSNGEREQASEPPSPPEPQKSKKKFRRVKQIEVSGDDPHEHDELNRKEDCSSLVDFIKNSEPPFTLAVDAEWGAGKTVFIKMLRERLAKENFDSLLFNAWECDFYEDPLIPLIVEISEGFPENSSIKQKIKDGGILLLQVLKAASPLISSYIPIPGGVDIVERLVSGRTRSKEFTPIEDYQKYREALKNFRASLGEAASENREGKPLVIFIDDLDRCSPAFAIKVLERVKHIFDVSPLFFVIAVNKKEFIGILESFYGFKDGERYLEKFFDLVFYLRNEKTLIESSLDKINFKSFQGKVSLKGRDIEESDYKKWLAGYLEPLSKTFGFTLRLQEKLAKTLEITLDKLDKTLDEEYYKLSSPSSPPSVSPEYEPPIKLQYPILCYFLALRIANPNLFHRSIENKITESIPWEEHIRFYLQKLGVDKELKMDSVVNTSSLQAVKSEESRQILLCLTVLFNLPENRSPNQLNLSDPLKEKLKDIKGLMRIENRFHADFRKLLGAIDFAGRSYKTENV